MLKPWMSSFWKGKQDLQTFLDECETWFVRWPRQRNILLLRHPVCIRKFKNLRFLLLIKLTRRTRNQKRLGQASRTSSEFHVPKRLSPTSVSDFQREAETRSKGQSSFQLHCYPVFSRWLAGSKKNPKTFARTLKLWQKSHQRRGFLALPEADLSFLMNQCYCTCKGPGKGRQMKKPSSQADGLS